MMYICELEKGKAYCSKYKTPNVKKMYGLIIEIENLL